MKKLFILIFLISFSQGYSADRLVYKYYFYLTNSFLAPEFSNTNGVMIYKGTDSEMEEFFSHYEILKFERAITAVEWESLRRVFIVETYNEKLANDLINLFPDVYEKFEEFTYEVTELASYPNDYGTTNPNIGQNIGPAIDRRDLDYINVSKAWDITDLAGAGDLIIGISDARINSTNADFSNKISFVNPSNYQSGGYDQNNIETWHGTAVAGLAAAQGNNGIGSTGVCKNCKIIGTQYANYDNLLLLAQNGAKVINMSWTHNYRHDFHQTVIDSLTIRDKVVLVAAAGNLSSFSTNQDFFCGEGYYNGSQFVPSSTGMKTYFPASYNNVISVSGIEHYNALLLPLTNSNPGFAGNNSGYTTPSYDVFTNIRDSFSQCVGNLNTNNPVGLNYNGWPQYCFSNGQYHLVSPLGIVANYTLNQHVDILAPTTKSFRFDKFIEQGVISYDGGGTSGASPIVAGTAALMIIANNCILPNEVDDVLKLTTKNIEILPINANFSGLGVLGAGKLETGDAVEFVNEMKKVDGNALIDGQDFNRFDFDLQIINNKLTISNQIFRDNNVSNFIAKKEILIKSGTTIKPNQNGGFHIGINPNISVTCSSSSKVGAIKNESINEIKKSKIILYPNPNKGDFKIDNIDFNLFNSKHIKISVLDINGRKLFENEIISDDNNSYNVNLQNSLPLGVYFVRLSSDNHVETLKFIVN